MIKKIVPIFGAILLIIIVFSIWLFMPPSIPESVLPDSADAVERGKYLVYAGGCIGCHKGMEDGDTLAGGRILESDFGKFYVPNITPDKETGIGNWTGSDFIRALKHGRRPDGGFYFPAFPYRSYAGLTDSDVLDMAAYLMTLPAVRSDVPDHELVYWLFPWMMAGWNVMADLMQKKPVPVSDPVLARGAYLVRHLGHCGECHTPRNKLGIPVSGDELAGAVMGEQVIEAIDVHALNGWTREDVKMLLLLGMKPDGEFVGGEMADVIDHNTSHLTDDDRAAIAAYLKSE